MEPILIPGLTGGLNTGQARQWLALAESPDSQNMTVKDGVARKRTGLTAHTGTGWTANKLFFHGHHYQDGITGAKYFWAFGENIRSKAAIGDNFSASLAGQMTIQTGNNWYFNTTEIVEFDDYKNYLIVNQTHTSHLSGVATTYWQPIFFANSPSAATGLTVLGGSAGYQNTVATDTGATGTNANPSVLTVADGVFTSSNTLVNYILQIVSGTNCTEGYYPIASNAEAASDTITLRSNASDGVGDMSALALNIYPPHFAKKVIAFADHLLLLHTLERISASTYCELFQRIRWSDVNHFTAEADWDDVNTAGAGYQDLKTDFGAILNAEVLFNSLIVYMDKAVYIGYHNGSATDPFDWQVMLPGIGLYAPRLLASNGQSHFFVGSDKQIYQLSGARDLRPIGDKIRTEFFNNLNCTIAGGINYGDRAWTHVLYDIEAVLFAIPTGVEDTNPVLAYVYFWREGRWEKWKFNNGSMAVTGMGDWDRPDALYSARMPVFSDASGNLYNFDYIAQDEAALAGVNSYITTKDFIFDHRHEGEAADIWFEASGSGGASSCNVSVSVDAGATYTDGLGGAAGTNQSVTVGTGWGLHHIRFNVAGYTVRFKFANSTAGQKLLLGGINIPASLRNESL